MKTERVKKMDPRLKKRWVAALRSGKYLQGQGKLYRPPLGRRQKRGRYCCLGVLYRVENKKNPADWENYYGSRHFGADIEIRLARMNDGFHMGVKSFKAIAKFIEQNL